MRNKVKVEQAVKEFKAAQKKFNESVREAGWEFDYVYPDDNRTPAEGVCVDDMTPFEGYHGFGSTWVVPKED